MRSAAAGARTRALNAGRRDAGERRSTDEVDDERDRRGLSTLRERRCGMPPRGEARRRANRVDRTTGASCLTTDDPKTFGFLGASPRVGSTVVLEREGEAAIRGKVAEVAELQDGYFFVSVSSLLR